MLEVYIYSASMLYNAMIQETIKKVFDEEKIKVQQIHSLEGDLKFQNCIFILDLDMEGGIEFFYKVREKNIEVPIILLTFQADSLLPSTLKQNRTYVISKSENIVHRLEDLFYTILKGNSFDENIVISADGAYLSLPLQDIVYFQYSKNRLVIYTMCNGKKYKYCMKMDQIFYTMHTDAVHIQNKKFELCLEGILKMNFQENSDEVSCRTYSEQEKEECNRLLDAGVSVQNIQKLHRASVASIYRWRREAKVQKKLRDTEENLKKYRQIEEIVRKE